MGPFGCLNSSWENSVYGWKHCSLSHKFLQIYLNSSKFLQTNRANIRSTISFNCSPKTMTTRFQALIISVSDLGLGIYQAISVSDLRLWRTTGTTRNRKSKWRRVTWKKSAALLTLSLPPEVASHDRGLTCSSRPTFLAKQDSYGWFSN